MHIEFLVEEQSAEAALEYILQSLLDDDTYRIISFQGKRDLLKKLPQRMKGYKSQDCYVVVLVDSDGQDCEELKDQLEQAASQAGLLTKTAAAGANKQVRVLNRIVIQELEAWFFGDVEAIRAAYPRVPDITNKKKYRVPDAIQQTWEKLEEILQQAGYHKSGLRKIEAATQIAKHMQPNRNCSQSFQAFRDGLQFLLKQ